MELKQELNWNKIDTLLSRTFVCGYCGSSIASQKGYYASAKDYNRLEVFIYICHLCTRPTFFDFDDNQTPGVVFGADVKDIHDTSVNDIYDEARRATSAKSYTAAVLCCRKLLMHIAVDKGAKVGENFATYVDYLSSNNYVPPGAKDWVDHIRKKGNEANHEIVIMNRDDAEQLLTFAEMLLKIIYELPAAVKKKYNPKSALQSGRT